MCIFFFFPPEIEIEVPWKKKKDRGARGGLKKKEQKDETGSKIKRIIACSQMCAARMT